MATSSVQARELPAQPAIAITVADDTCPSTACSAGLSFATANSRGRTDRHVALCAERPRDRPTATRSAADDRNSPPDPLLAWKKPAERPLGNQATASSHCAPNDGRRGSYADVSTRTRSRSSPASPGASAHPFLEEGTDPAVRDAAREAASPGAATGSRRDHPLVRRLCSNAPYVRCSAGRRQARSPGWRRRYLDSRARRCRAGDGSSPRATLGRDVPHVLLLHIGVFTSRMLPRLDRSLSRHGLFLRGAGSRRRTPSRGGRPTEARPVPDARSAGEADDHAATRQSGPSLGDEVCAGEARCRGRRQRRYNQGARQEPAR